MDPEVIVLAEITEAVVALDEEVMFIIEHTEFSSHSYGYGILSCLSKSFNKVEVFDFKIERRNKNSPFSSKSSLFIEENKLFVVFKI